MANSRNQDLSRKAKYVERSALTLPKVIDAAKKIVGKDGVVKLMDFGIARPTDASIHTTDGSILGTMQYLSPEQLDGKEPDVRTDIYSLGTTMYEVLTGVQAFPEGSGFASLVVNDGYQWTVMLIMLGVGAIAGAIGSAIAASKFLDV